MVGIQNVDDTDFITTQNIYMKAVGVRGKRYKDRGTFNIYTENKNFIEVVTFPHRSDAVVENKTPLLFIHGWGLSAHSYAQPLSLLSERYYVYAPTLPGFGKSSPLRKEFVLDDFASSVDKVWGECELSDNPVPIVAHSMGCGVAIKLALSTTNKVESLTLICPIGGAGALVDWTHIVASFKEDVTFNMLQHVKDSIPHLVRNPLSALRSAYLAKTADLADEIKACVAKGIPVTIVFATHDSITPPGKIKEIEGVSYLLEEGTHGWPLKKPARFKEIILEIHNKK